MDILRAQWSKLYANQLEREGRRVSEVREPFEPCQRLHLEGANLSKSDKVLKTAFYDIDC